jgi:hypothetical protein
MMEELRRRVGWRARRLYRATKKSHKALDFTKGKVRELFGELIEGPVTRAVADGLLPASDIPEGDPIGLNLRNRDSVRVSKPTDSGNEDHPPLRDIVRPTHGPDTTQLCHRLWSVRIERAYLRTEGHW